MSFNPKIQFIIKSEKINIIDNIKFIEAMHTTTLLKNIDHFTTNEKNINKYAQLIVKEYLELLNDISEESKKSSKSFYIALFYPNGIYKNSDVVKKSYIDKLMLSYQKLKETLEDCGNVVYELNIDHSLDLIYSFLDKFI